MHFFKFLEPDGIIDPNVYARSGPMGYSIAKSIFTRHLAKAGLAHKGYSLYCLRHTFTTDLLNAGMCLECLQQLLGHAKIDVSGICANNGSNF